MPPSSRHARCLSQPQQDSPALRAAAGRSLVSLFGDALFCPACGVELKIVTRPTGYVVNTLMISVSAYILFHLPNPPAFLCANPWTLIGGPLLIVLPFAIALRKWGFRYSFVAEEPASGNPVGETRC